MCKKEGTVMVLRLVLLIAALVLRAMTPAVAWEADGNRSGSVG